MAPRGWTVVALLLAVVGALCVAAPVASAASDDFKTNVIELRSENFEHLTQAASGATTGDWLVEFYAPWCGHCKRFAPTYEKIADELKGKINVASVDVSEHYDLGKRFDIKGFPTIVLLRQGKLYKFSGQRNQEEVMRFARSGYKTLVSVPVPPEINLFTDIERHIGIIYEDFLKLLATKKNVLLVTFSGGLLVGLLLGWMCSCCTARAPAPKPAAKPKTN